MNDTAITLNGFPVERRRLDELVKAPWNPRRISDEQAQALKRSLAEFGTVEPIVVNKTTGNIVGGHMRLDALLALQVGNQKHPLEQRAKDHARGCGLEYIETRASGMTNNWTETPEDEGEVVVLFRKS